MATDLEDLKVLQGAERVADDLWQEVLTWSEFARDTLGKQAVRAADSIGANIAESFGRFSFGEKLQFLYYARGSLFETKYWLNRAARRDLMTGNQHDQYASQLVILGRQLNNFANSLKSQRAGSAYTTKSRFHEVGPGYSSNPDELELPDALLDDHELQWLSSSSISESPCF